MENKDDTKRVVASNVKRKQMQQVYNSAAVFSTNFEKGGQEEAHSLISGTDLP